MTASEGALIVVESQKGSGKGATEDLLVFTCWFEVA